MMQPTKPGEPTGTPNPGQVPLPGQQAPANQPGAPAQGKVQTPPPGAPGEQTVPLKALQEEREKRQALQSELDQVRQYVQQQQQQPNAGTIYNAPQVPQQGQGSTINQGREQIERLWETDPRQAVRAEIDHSLSYYDTVNAQIESQANFLASKYPDFNNYRSTAMNYIRTLPYGQRAQNGIVELAYMVARGQNVDTILQTREQELMEKFKTGQLAGSLQHPAGAGGQPFTPAGGFNLTPEQQTAARAMRMSDADYAANMKATR